MNDVLYLDNLKSFSDLHALLYFWAQYLNTIIIWLSRILKLTKAYLHLILSFSINQRIERKRHCIYPKQRVFFIEEASFIKDKSF